MKVAYCEECDETVEVYQDPTELGGQYFCCSCGSTIKEREVEEVTDELSG
jgi:DNA replicative helicase MCM subunit Mcm2 (Cdc46/Mcm family)